MEKFSDPSPVVTDCQSMRADFNTTRWTIVIDAGKTSGPECRTALEILCRAYWEPLNAYVCRSGRSREDAQDITQAFFEHLLANNLPSRADPQIGRFRTFLLTSLRNFMLTRHRDATRQKRGGLISEHLSIDELAEILPAEGESPETAYERKWAQTLVNISLDELARQQSDSGNHARFSLLRPILLDSADSAALQARLVTEHGMTDGSIRTTLSRLRSRFREIVRQEVARLVDDPAEVDDELAHLLRAMG
jgi:DNA-directed RNA polymerase specialized sigma24 family protein